MPTAALESRALSTLKATISCPPCCPSGFWHHALSLWILFQFRFSENGRAQPSARGKTERVHTFILWLSPRSPSSAPSSTFLFNLIVKAFDWLFLLFRIFWEFVWLRQIVQGRATVIELSSTILFSKQSLSFRSAVYMHPFSPFAS